MEFRILGPLEVHEDACRLPLGGTKQRALLAVLVLNANRVVSTDAIVAALWGERPPTTATAALHGHVAALRKLLDPSRSRGDPGRVLVTRPPGYLLRCEPEQVDLARFERLRGEAAAARASGDLDASVARLGEALALWRGPALADLADEPFAPAELPRLDELHVAACEERLEIELELGRATTVVSELERLVAAHPLRERPRRLLMLALYRSGRQAEALEAYRHARHALVDELGIEPSRDLQELERAILLQHPSLDGASRAHPEPPLRSASGSERAGDAPARRTGTFVGREREVRVGLEALENAFAGRPSLLLIAGEPGMGKTGLADELAARAASRGARVLWGRCWEAGGAPPYWPWVQALRAYVADVDPSRLHAELGPGAGEVARMLPELGEGLDGVAPRQAADPAAARFRLFDATTSFLRAAARSQPLVLVLDDLHAADEPSLLLLRFLARGLGDARVLVIGAFRDTEVDAGEALTAAVAELAREPVTRTVELGGLSLPEVERLVDATLGAPGGDRLAAALHAETEGSPLFIGELLRLLIAQDRLDVGAQPWELEIPRGLQEVIGHRLRHLSPECTHVLSLASVFGRGFRLDALARLSEREPEELLEILDEALAARVVGESPGAVGAMRFSHALIRGSLYGGLRAAERVRLHRRAGRILVELYGRRLEPHLTELAHHFLKAAPAGDVDTAVDFARRAGDRASGALAYEEAARLYGRALQALELNEDADEATRCDLLLARGNAQVRGGDMEGGRDTLAAAADVARALGDARRLGLAAWGYGGRWVWFRAGADGRLVPLLEDALAAQPPGDSAVRARLLARLAGALRDHPEPDRRRRLGREAVDMARRIGDPVVLSETLGAIYCGLSLPDDLDAWQALGRELRTASGTGDDVENRVFGLSHSFGAAMMGGDIREANDVLRRLLAAAEELRQPIHHFATEVMVGMMALFESRLDDAERQLARVLELGVAAQGSDATLHFVEHAQTWALRREQRRLAEYLPHLEQAADAFPMLTVLRCLQASTLADLGRVAEARALLAELTADDLAALHVGTEWLFEACVLADAAATAGDEVAARRLHAALSPYAGCASYVHPEVWLGSVSHHVGRLAATLGDWPEAAAAFERAIEFNAARGARGLAAHSRRECAAMLLEPGAAADGEGAATATALLRQARDDYVALGMDGWVAAVDELTARIPGAAFR